MSLEEIIEKYATTKDNLKQLLNPLTLATEFSLIARFLTYAIKELQNPQEIKQHKRLIEKIEINDPTHNAKLNPVLLVPGYLESPRIYYNHLDNLRLSGITHAYWVEGYPFKSIEENADILLDIVYGVVKRTNKDKVNLIGHSMGGLVIVYFAINHPNLVDKCISIATPFKGTIFANRAYEILEKIITKSGIENIEGYGYSFESLREMFYESEFTKNLNINNNIDYYSIFSCNDEVILPWNSAIKKGAININVNKDLGLNNIGHIRLLYKNRVREIIVEILNNVIDKERFGLDY